MTKWDSDNLYLLTPAEFAKLPDGIELMSILNTKVVKGVDRLASARRRGHLAYGIADIFNHSDKRIRDLAIIFTLSQ